MSNAGIMPEPHRAKIRGAWDDERRARHGQLMSANAAIRRKRVPPALPAQFDVGDCCDCGRVVVRGMSERGPIRCSDCRAGRVEAVMELRRKVAA